MSIEWKLGNNLWIRVENASYGVCVKFRRKTRFTAISANVWGRLRRNIPLMSTEGYSLKLTDRKDIKVELFNGIRYVKLHTTYKCDGEDCDSYINMNEDEFSELLKVLNKVDSLIPPHPIVPCPDCKVIKMVVQVSQNGNRMLPTTLTPEQLKDVMDNNDLAYNQMMYQCTYCSGYENGDCCHCHKFDCRKCEPANFCNTCGAVKVFAV